MLIQAKYEVPDDVDINPIDPDVNDVFDMKLLEKGNEVSGIFWGLWRVCTPLMCTRVLFVALTADTATQE